MLTQDTEFSVYIYNLDLDVLDAMRFFEILSHDRLDVSIGDFADGVLYHLLERGLMLRLEVRERFHVQGIIDLRTMYSSWLTDLSGAGTP